jgi:redox-sensitive bicupin YhaK (pirin superfamily)
MSAGRGIIHSEMPEQEEGRMAGFQLWVNLAAKDKMQPPAYRDVAPAQVPAFTLEDGTAVRVIAGQTHGVSGAVTRPTTEPLVLDITIPAGVRFELPLPAGHNAFAYVYGGVAAEIGGAPVASEHMAILRNEPEADGVRFTAPAGGRAVQVLFVAGAPLNEPIAQYGPFVMNTAQEIHQAMADFQRGVLAT